MVKVAAEDAKRLPSCLENFKWTKLACPVIRCLTSKKHCRPIRKRELPETKPAKGRNPVFGPGNIQPPKFRRRAVRAGKLQGPTTAGDASHCPVHIFNRKKFTQRYSKGALSTCRLRLNQEEKIPVRSLRDGPCGVGE